MPVKRNGRYSMVLFKRHGNSSGPPGEDGRSRPVSFEEWIVRGPANRLLGFDLAYPVHFSDEWLQDE